MACDHLLLEWAGPDDRRWPLPPHNLLLQKPLQRLPKPSPGKVSPGKVSLAEAWKRGFEDASLLLPENIEPSSDAKDEFEVLTRIRISVAAPQEEASLMLGDFWLPLDLSTATVGILCDGIKNFLRHESSYHCESGEELQTKMMDLNHPNSEVLVPRETPLRDWCWTHSETLTVKIDKPIVRIWRERELSQEALSIRFKEHDQLSGPPVATPTLSSEKDSFSDANSLASEITAQSKHSDDRAVLSGGIEGALARVMPHYPPQYIANTKQIRQFEFHPCLPNIVLTGDHKGGVNIVQTDDESVHTRLLVDHMPVLALSWMHHHPHTAVCGTADVGNIVFLRFNSEATAQDVALQPVLKTQSFPRLSSLSVNCTDDFLLASGLTHDLALYDIQTGQMLHQAFGAHSHSINISRFANSSPHVFATASFDHTCKVWDIRQPIHGDSPIKLLHTGGPNVMCNFAPGDKQLLCSGIDTHIVQYDLPSCRVAYKSFPLRPETHQAHYRRSMYFASGRQFVTSATHEAHIRIMSSSGLNMGVVNFQGVLRDARAQGLETPESFGQSSEQPSWFFQRSQGREEPVSLMWDSSMLVQGDAWLEVGPQTEYVQSVRTHPVVENCVGALLSSYDADPHTCLSLVHTAPSPESE
jgi:WD40 repeat protein